MKMNVDLTGTRALVTGASSDGFGAHFAKVLAAAGAEVVVAARRKAPLEALAESIRQSGGRAIPLELDVSCADAIEEKFAQCEPFDIVVNNAGVERSASVLDFSESDYDHVLGVNLKGLWLVSLEASRKLRDAGKGGSIINIASITGHRPMKGAAPYGISKAGVLHLTRQLACELARFNIRVNSISPGYFATDLNREFLLSEHGTALRQRIALRRFGEYSDLDGALLLLASDASSFITGSDLVVDGGHLVAPL